MQRLLAVLEAAGRDPGRCRYASRTSWPLGAILGYLAVLATGAERPLPVWLLVFVATGTSGVSLLEYKVFRRLPASLPALATALAGLALLPLVPRDPYVEGVYSLAVLSLGYGLTVLAYAVRSLSLAGSPGES